jgi:hypothetical protein
MILFIYQAAEKLDGADGAIAVIAHSEQNAQDQVRLFLQRHPKGVGLGNDDIRFYIHEPRREYANQYRFPWVLKERFVVAGCIAQRVVLFTFSRG